jgi:hypothetical protein
MRVRFVLAAAAILAAGGCGDREPALPVACAGGVEPLAAALDAAPGRVTLEGGLGVSRCLRAGAGDAEVLELGATTSRLADRLAAQTAQDERAAVKLGYLVGAVRRGARRTNGVHAELVRRLEQAAGSVDAARREALRRGMLAGERTG